MAKITCTFDTESKDLEVAIDGKAVENVTGVCFYPLSYDGDGDDFRCTVNTKVEDEDSGIKTFMTMMASEMKDAKVAVEQSKASESSDFPGFVIAKDNRQSKTEQDIASYFSKG